MPIAPGTFGTAVAVVFLVLVHMPPVLYIIFTIAVTVVGTYASGMVEEIMKKKDPSCVVIDEFAGYLVSMAFLPVTAQYLIYSFILFRIFDILKPPPLYRLQDLKGGMGIMADDIGAGIYTNVLLQLWKQMN